METNNNSAKFAFFYLLSLVALIFMSLSTGMIIFQIINKHIADIINQYQGRFSQESLKFAISALIISAPIYYLTTWQILKNLKSGILEKNSGIRRWLTYFILLVTSVVALGWLIGIINTFLDGDLTLKFGLKALTAIIISAAVFTFYLFDIKREDVQVGGKLIKIYFYASLVVIIIAFVSSLFTVESPIQTRNRKIDEAILNNFSIINSDLNLYFNDYKKLPDNLNQLIEEYGSLTQKNLEDPETNAKFDFKKLSNDSYELCANFRASNMDEDDSFRYIMDSSRHEAGYQCLKQKIRTEDGPAVKNMLR